MPDPVHLLRSAHGVEEGWELAVTAVAAAAAGRGSRRPEPQAAVFLLFG